MYLIDFPDYIFLKNILQNSNSNNLKIKNHRLLKRFLPVKLSGKVSVWQTKEKNYFFNFFGTCVKFCFMKVVKTNVYKIAIYAN